jgi:hypothetical protein
MSPLFYAVGASGLFNLQAEGYFISIAKRL